MKKVLWVFGAGSGIGKAFSFYAMKSGYEVVLFGRKKDELEILSDDLEVRVGRRPKGIFDWDVLNLETLKEILQKGAEEEPVHGAFISFGVMYDQALCEEDHEKLSHMFQINLVGTIALVEALIPYISDGGFISCVSSVAGDLGRAKNHIYGASKAGLNVYLEGLRARLFSKGILVQVVKPGPVDTPMIRGLGPMPFVAKPEKVAKAIILGIQKKKNEVYSLWIWRWIMFVLCSLPSFIKKRLSF